MTKFLIAFLADLNDPTYTPVHVVTDPGWHVVTISGYPAGQPITNDGGIVTDYTGIYSADYARESLGVAIYPHLGNELRAVEHWTAYTDTVCTDDGPCTYAELYPLEIDFTDVEPDARGVRTITVAHGTVELWPTVTQRELRKALRTGVVELGRSLMIGSEIFPINGSPEVLYKK